LRKVIVKKQQHSLFTFIVLTIAPALPLMAQPPAYTTVTKKLCHKGDAEFDGEFIE
jgi:hypothetical protein